MKKLIILIGVILLFFISVCADEQAAINPCHYSTEGRDFWFGLMQNRSKFTDHLIEITVTSRYDTQFTLSYGPNEIPIGGTYSLSANASTTVPIDYNLLEALGSENVENKGLHLISTNPVNVYALNYRTQSSDVAVIYPTESLGKEYFAMCYTPKISGSNESNSEFLIVATENNTSVKITPKVDTDQGKKANQIFTVVLNKGQSYQVQSMNSAVAGQGDLTGSYISSDKPVAFFSGSKAVPVPSTGNSYDHLYEQIPPTSTWGSMFYVVPLKLKNKDTYRILAAEDGTVVTIEGTNTVLKLNRGDYSEFELNSSQACRITSTKKIILAQYCRTQNVDGNGGVGDPFMIILSPISQKINDVTFVAYESAKIKNIFYVNVIAPTAEVGNISLDGTNIGSFFIPFPNKEYSYAQIPTSKGAHRMRNSDSKGGFLAFIYGFGDNGNTESYGYGVGFNLDLQLELGGNLSQDTLLICKGAEAKLEAGAYFEKYKWNTGDTLSSIKVSKEGLYYVTASTLAGCTLSDSLYVKVNDQKIDFGKDTSSCGAGKIILDAGKGFKTYQWQDGSVNQTYPVIKTGDYWVVGTNEFDCQVKDTIHVDVFQVPEVKIKGDTLHCGVFTSELIVDVVNADTDLWNYAGAGNWTCSSPDLEFVNIKPDRANLKANKPGLYKVNYTLTTKDGCSDSDTFDVGFFEVPESSFTVDSPESSDKCSSYERIVKYTGKNSLSAKYSWDFGGLIVLDTIGPNHFKVSIGANKPNRTISLVVKDNGCTSPLTSKSIGVNPTFNFGADKVHGCDAMCVQFNSQVTIMDAVTYHWTFGDGAVSDLQNPLHCYGDTGKYDVSLIVTNVIDGCQNGSVEPQMIKIYPTPKAAISADPAFCYGDTVSFSYLNSKDNSHCKWVEKGNKLLSEENTRASYLLTNEISEIGFIVEENGCSCDTLKVRVKRKPHFDFQAVETEICQPSPALLKAMPKDPNLQFSWTVDSLQQIQGDSLIHLFPQAGFYAVTLEAFSNLTGCSAVLTKKQFIHVYPLPVPAFNQNFRIATLEHPEISFQNLSEGALSYLWDFGDGSTSEEVHPKHKYADMGDYQVILQAFTDFGCADTITSRVKIIPFSFFAPNAFRPESDIAENRIFLPVREGVDPEKYRFEVFNRLGSPVFDTRDPESGWNGKLPNGSSAEPGVYVWIVKFSDIQGYDHLQKGTVMLVR